MQAVLAGLSPDPERHGVHTIPKGDCAGCGKPIVGQIVVALNKNWHPEHYVCCQCGTELARRPYYERGGKAYCETDYHDMFSPRCAACNGPIKERCLNALNRTYHVEHFTCAECNCQFGPEGFHEKDGVPYCKTDYLRLFAPRCRRCSNPVRGRFVTALGAAWDQECFVCQDCSRPFSSGTFFELNGIPLCEQHVHERRGTVCNQCRQPIVGRCVLALGQKFHPEHFTCSSCGHQVKRHNYKQVNNRCLCQRCFEKINPSFELFAD